MLIEERGLAWWELFVGEWLSCLNDLVHIGDRCLEILAVPIVIGSLLTLLLRHLLLDWMVWHRMLLRLQKQIERVKSLSLLEAPISINLVPLGCHLPLEMSLLATLVLNVEPNL